MSKKEYTIDKIEKDTKQALLVLNKFRKYDRYASILGGFPRDLYLKRNYRDVDVYIRGNTEFNTVDFEHFIRGTLEGHSLENYQQTGSKMKDSFGKILNTSEVEVDGLLFNFIFTKNIMKPQVDFDICMFYLDNSGIPRFSKGVCPFPEIKTITANSNISNTQLEFSLKNHLPKLKEKFKDYQFVISKVL